jgi:hypothetical protein
VNGKLRGQIDLIALAVIPIFYLAINPTFGQNQIGDPDTWFYFGLAKSFWHQRGPDFLNDYYETRLPYIIPAAIIFTIPNEKAATFILSYLVYCCSAFSLFYVLCRHVPKPTALLATILMASDIFFMRAVGWQYVDGGVLAYGSLSFAAIAAARATCYKRIFLFLSGFLYASMLIVHLGSAPFGLGLFGYAIFTFDLRRLTWKEIITLIFWVGLGVAICQFLYGLLNMYLYGTEFWFETQQIKAGRITQQNVAHWEELKLSLPLVDGWWLVLHVGVWFAAAAMLLAKLAKLAQPTPFQVYCIWAVLGTYSILFVPDYFGITAFLARSGLYVTTYLFLSYLFIGSVLPRTIRTSTTLICGGLFLGSLGLRLQFGFEFAKEELQAVSAWEVGMVLGLLIAVVAFGRRNGLNDVVAPTAAALLLMATWGFADQGEVYAARDAVATAVGDTLPYFAYSEEDPAFLPFGVGLVGSFSPRAWWMSCRGFPDCTVRSVGHATMIVVTGNSDSADISRTAALAMPEISVQNAKLIYRSNDAFSVYRVDIESLPILIPGAKLYSIVGNVEGSARAAAQGTASGYLTYGPYANFDPGRYEITFKYQAEGDTGSWDVVAGNNVSTLAQGVIPDSNGMTNNIVIALDLPNGAVALQARTLYAGRGRLSVQSLGIKRLSGEPAAR